MLFGSKKSSVIDRRIRELRKEMERVQGEMKTAVRPEPAKPQRVPPPPPPGSRPVFAAKPPLSREENDLFAHASRQAQGSGSDAEGQSVNSSYFDQADANPQAGRKKFANYFMAGHFQNLRPSRQESRIVRNKAIVMMILVLGVIFWLVYYFQTH